MVARCGTIIREYHGGIDAKEQEIVALWKSSEDFGCSIMPLLNSDLAIICR